MHSFRIQTVLRSLPLILLVALGLRLDYARNYESTRSRQALGAIPFLFEPGNIAASLADGKGFGSPLRVDSGPTAWMTPAYPLLLAGVFRVFGKYTFSAWQAAAALNILFGVLTCIPIFKIGFEIGGLNVAAVAAWLWAVFPNALIIPVESMWDASLAALLGAGLILFTLRIAGSRNWWLWAAYGLFWGLVLMTSATFALAVPFVAGWLAWRSRSLARPAAAVFSMVLACAPWTVRNYLALHSLVPLRSVTGLSLWLGTIDPDLGRWPASFHPITDSEERARFLELGEIAYMQAKQHEALQFIAAHPGTELRLCAQRFAGLWAGGALHPIDALMHARSGWFRLVLLSNVALALLGLAGIVILGIRRNSGWMALSILPLAIPLGFYLTLASARYRLLVDPEVTVLAAAAIVRPRDDGR